MATKDTSGATGTGATTYKNPALSSLSAQNVAVIKTKVMDITLNSTVEGYSVEINYDVKTKADSSGLPSLDLSKDINLYIKSYIVVDSSLDADLQQYDGDLKDGLRTAHISTKNILDKKVFYQKEKLTYQTILPSGIINPDIKINYRVTEREIDGIIQKIKVPERYSYPFSLTQKVKKTRTLVIYLFKCTGKDAATNVAFDRIPIIENSILKVEKEDSKIEDLRTGYYDNLFNFDIFSVNEPVKNSNISDLLASYGKNQDLKATFFFDKKQFLIDNSIYGQILNNPHLNSAEINKILQNAFISNLIIKRRKVKNILDFHKRPISVDKNQINDILIQTSDDDSGNLLKKQSTSSIDESILAEISEIQLPLQFDNASLTEELTKFYKVYGFSDYDTLMGGKHQYRVSIKMQDGILIWLINALARLERAQKTLTDFYKIGKPAYEAGSFFHQARQALDGDILNILFALNTTTPETVIDRSYFKNLLNYKDTTLKLMGYNLILVSKVAQMIGSAGVISQTNSSYSKIFSKNVSDLFFLKTEKEFDLSVDFGDASDLTYDYVNIGKNEDVGISIIESVDFNSRCNFDFRRIIKDYVADDNGEIDFSKLNFNLSFDAGIVPGTSALASSMARLFDFENNYYSFLAPKKINNTFLTEENSFRSDTFNELHYKNKFDPNYTPNLSISYYLRSIGISIGGLSYNNVLALKEEQNTYSNFGTVFPGDSNIDAPAEIPDSYDTIVDGVSQLDEETNTYVSFINSILRQDENWDLSIENFDILNTDLNLLTQPVEAPATKRSSTGLPLNNNLSPSERRAEDLLRNEIVELPNHIRAIFASKSDKVVNQWLNMFGDYFASPDNYYMIKENYMNLVKIEVLSTFATDVSGIPNVKNPVFVKLTGNKIKNLLEGQYLLCKAALYDNQKYKIGTSFERRSYSDKYFLIKGSAPSEIGAFNETGIRIEQTPAIEVLESPAGIGGETKFQAVDVPEIIQAGFSPFTFGGN